MNTKLTIIGLSGTNGAGKDTIGELLAAQHGYLFISVTELLREECRRRGLPVARQHLHNISAEWRRAYGLAVLVDRAIAQYQAAKGEYVGLVMSSIRNSHEAIRIHELGGTMVWIDADPKIRYQRVAAADRGRAAEDNKTYEEFLAEEAAEMQQTGDEATLNMDEVKKQSDVLFMNNSTDMETLERELRRTLGL
jgi:cytidylate kinase